MNESTKQREAWIKPMVYDLSRLTELTLTTGGIPGGDFATNSGGGVLV